MTPAGKGEREVAEEILTESEILLKNTRAMMADKGYDSEFIEEQGIIAVIPPRHMWKDEEVFYRTEDFQLISLVYKGTDSLRYRFHPKYNDNRIFRVDSSEDIRIFPKVSQ